MLLCQAHKTEFVLIIHIVDRMRGKNQFCDMFFSLQFIGGRGGSLIYVCLMWDYETTVSSLWSDSLNPKWLSQLSGLLPEQLLALWSQQKLLCSHLLDLASREARSFSSKQSWALSSRGKQLQRSAFKCKIVHTVMLIATQQHPPLIEVRVLLQEMSQKASFEPKSKGFIHMWFQKCI